MNASGYSVLAEGLQKQYGDKKALNGLSLAVGRGTVLGLLGPNGAGKTTAVRILTTLVKPGGGRAWVGGFDIAKQPHEVRRTIGLAGQHPAVDEILTARQNLEMFGRLFHLDRRAARRRAVELLDQFDLGEAANRSPFGFSGGMKRRLDLAASMVLAPEVLFLDEPTTGLDPRGRTEVWESVRNLAAQGTTVLLTTHYLDEADKLADRIALIDQGRLVTEDTPAGLKRAVGGDRVEVVLQDPGDLPAAIRAIAPHTGGSEPRTEEAGVRVHGPVRDGVTALTEVARTLQEDRVPVVDLGLRRPTLDDVFLRLTGRSAEGGHTAPPDSAAPDDRTTEWEPAGVAPATPSVPAGATAPAAATQQKENER